MGDHYWRLAGAALVAVVVSTVIGQPGEQNGFRLAHAIVEYATALLTNLFAAADGWLMYAGAAALLCALGIFVASRLVSPERAATTFRASAPRRHWRSASAKGSRSISDAALGLISGHVEYLRKQRHRIRYAGARRRGHPIGSGPTEGACKSVVAMRFKRSGQRWFETGLAPCLFLRSLHLSERLRPCFEILQATQIASLRAA